MRGFACVLGLALLAPVAAAAGSRSIVTNYRLDYVKLESIAKKELAVKAPTHPVTIPTEQMRQMLASVRLNRKLFLKKAIVSQEVFNERAVNFLAPYLVKAFQEATPEEEVVFSWLWKDPELIIRNDRVTVAKAWVKGNEFHLEFLKLQAKLVGDYDKRGNFDKIVNRAKGLRRELEAQPGQMLGSSNADELIIDMAHVMTAPPARTAGTAPAPSSTASPLNERLQELNKLRKANLLTEDEYQAKRRELLQQL